MGPLSGLKVLDFSRLLPGPLCTHLLVRLGASVVKIEAPSQDYARDIPPLIRSYKCISNRLSEYLQLISALFAFNRFDKNTEHGAFYEALNGDKKNIMVDLKDTEQRQIIRKLARTYDVVVEGNRPGVMDRLGLGYEDLKKENPGLIYCSLSGYGATGPLAQ